MLVREAGWPENVGEPYSGRRQQRPHPDFLPSEFVAFAFSIVSLVKLRHGGGYRMYKGQHTFTSRALKFGVRIRPFST